MSQYDLYHAQAVADGTKLPSDSTVFNKDGKQKVSGYDVFALDFRDTWNMEHPELSDCQVVCLWSHCALSVFVLSITTACCLCAVTVTVLSLTNVLSLSLRSHYHCALTPCALIITMRSLAVLCSLS